jgi:hypothetical protein
VSEGFWQAERRHERAVGDVHILAGVDLVEFVEHRLLRVVAHAAVPLSWMLLPTLIGVALDRDVLVARGLEHLGRVVLHVFFHLALVLAHDGVDDQQRQAVLVFLVAIEPRVVVVVRAGFSPKASCRSSMVPARALPS